MPAVTSLSAAIPAAQGERSAPRPQRGWRKLAMAVALLALVWGVVLPRLGETTAVRTMIERHKRQGIDPSAMYYSDLEHLEYRDSMLRRPIPDGDAAPASAAWHPRP